METLKRVFTDHTIKSRGIPDDMRHSKLVALRAAHFADGIVNLYRQRFRGDPDCTLNAIATGVSKLFQPEAQELFGEWAGYGRPIRGPALRNIISSSPKRRSPPAPRAAWHWLLPPPAATKKADRSNRSAFLIFRVMPRSCRSARRNASGAAPPARGSPPASGTRRTPSR